MGLLWWVLLCASVVVYVTLPVRYIRWRPGACSQKILYIARKDSFGLNQHLRLEGFSALGAKQGLRSGHDASLMAGVLPHATRMLYHLH